MIYRSSKVALLAFVGRFGVRDHVTGEMVFSDESMIADVAFVGLMTGMDS